MCGIAGIVDFNDKPDILQDVLKEMTRRLAHRGPDGEGFYFGDNVAIGHRRLSVIDIEGGAQPMTNEDERYWLIYNGEIYNFKDLMEELKARGHHFKTRCDTEVILHAYEEWGEKCLDRFNGMFAFALWDEEEEKLFFARDRLGIKPFFFAHDGKRLVFSSEIQALLPALKSKPQLDEYGLTAYFMVQYVPSPDTIFKEIKKLSPATAGLFDRHGLKIWRWWKLPEGTIPDEGRASEELLSLLEDSVKLRLVSDVPLGAFLSGGIDSSSVVALMARNSCERVRTFQVTFQEYPSYDESYFGLTASKAFGTVHHILDMKASDMIELLPKIMTSMGEPVADPALVPTYMVSKLARQHVTVVLTGEGADELFGGYLRYSLERLSYLWSLVPSFAKNYFSQLLKKIPRSERALKALNAMNLPAGGKRHLGWLMTLPLEELAELLPTADVIANTEKLACIFSLYFKGENKTNPLKDTLRCDLSTWLPDDLLAKVDFMSMSHGLEARVPYLDYRLVEWVFKLPPKKLMQGLKRKAILKEAVRSFVPKEIVNRPKRGFTLPIKEWFSGALKNFLWDTLSGKDVNSIFEPTTLKEWLQAHCAGRRELSARLFSALLLILWLKECQ